MQKFDISRSRAVVYMSTMHTWNLYLHQDDFYFDRRKRLNVDLSPSNKHNLDKIQNAKKEK